MSLDPERLEAAIRRDAAAEVRALLLDATEADRRECTRALRSLLDGPDLARLEASAAGRLLAEWDAIRNSAGGGLSPVGRCCARGSPSWPPRTCSTRCRADCDPARAGRPRRLRPLAAWPSVAIHSAR